MCLNVVKTPGATEKVTIRNVVMEVRRVDICCYFSAMSWFQLKSSCLCFLTPMYSLEVLFFFLSSPSYLITSTSPVCLRPSEGHLACMHLSLQFGEEELPPLELKYLGSCSQMRGK